jgi:hypothetical protein
MASAPAAETKKTAAGAGELCAEGCRKLEQLRGDQDADGDPNDHERHEHRSERAK